MALETEMAALTAALKENTAAHMALTKVAAAAAGSKTEAAPKAGAKPPVEKAPAAKTPAAKAPAAKAPASKAPAAKKAKLPEIFGEVDKATLVAASRAYLATDDEDELEARKANMVAAYEHLGVKKISDLADDAERAKLFAYIAYWTVAAEVDFEELDELVGEQVSDEDEEEDDGDDE